MSLPCQISDLIPQKNKMGFAQTLVKAKNDDAESTAVINKDNIFLDDKGQLSNAVLIEYINQLISAIHGYNGKDDNKPPQKGLFVGIQEAEFLQPVFSGDLLTLKASVMEEVTRVTFVQGLIYRGGEKVAGLVTKLYEVRDLAEFDLITDHNQTPEDNNSLVMNQYEPPAYLASGMQRKLFTYLADLQTRDDSISFNISCPDDFEAFDGHFPGNPILPGVVLLEIADLAIKLLLHKPVVIKAIKRMKISGVVLPNRVVSCVVTVDKHAQPVVSFTATFKDNEAREISRFSGYFNEGKA